MGEHDELGGRKYRAMYAGIVVDNKDPVKLGRVKLSVPGIVEPASDWAFPVGASGAGGPNRGFYFVPPVHATVCVWFLEGDIDRPYYAPGHWGQTAPGSRETPGPVGGYKGSADRTGDDDLSTLSPADAVLVRAIETDRFIIIIDDRPGKERMILRDKKSEDQIEFDGVAYGITVRGTTAVRILADGAIDLRGASITLNGRAVLPSGKPIA